MRELNIKITCGDHDPEKVNYDQAAITGNERFYLYEIPIILTRFLCSLLLEADVHGIRHDQLLRDVEEIPHDCGTCAASVEECPHSADGGVDGGTECTSWKPA
ncbi:MAG: hypothetical protein KAU20_02410 [Nanoarchaeota archaeon]|nr:hypothetical protein [Nanoarchaeota archaeon]